MALAALRAAGHPGRFWAERPIELCPPGGTHSEGGQADTRETAHKGVCRPRCGALGAGRWDVSGGVGCWENCTRRGEAESAAEATSRPAFAEPGEVAALGWAA